MLINPIDCVFELWDDCNNVVQNAFYSENGSTDVSPSGWNGGSFAYSKYAFLFDLPCSSESILIPYSLQEIKHNNIIFVKINEIKWMINHSTILLFMRILRIVRRIAQNCLKKRMSYVSGCIRVYWNTLVSTRVHLEVLGWTRVYLGVPGMYQNAPGRTGWNRVYLCIHGRTNWSALGYTRIHWCETGCTRGAASRCTWYKFKNNRATLPEFWQNYWKTWLYPQT